MIPLTTQRYDWGYVSGRIAALEARFLGREFIQGLLSARVDELLRQLQDTPWGAPMTAGTTFDDCSALIDQRFFEIADSLRHDSPDPTPFDLFLMQGDFLNLKRAVSGEAHFPFPTVRIGAEDLARVAAGDLGAAPDDVREAVEGMDPEMDVTQRRTFYDIILDGSYLRHLMELGSGADAPLIRQYVETQVLARAVVVLWRALRSGHAGYAYRRYFLPVDPYTPLLRQLLELDDPATWADVIGGDLGVYMTEAAQRPEDDQAPRFEQLVANELNRLAEHGRYQVFGPERVLSFMAALATEAYNVKVAVCGRLNGIDPGLLRQRLRESYA